MSLTTGRVAAGIGELFFQKNIKNPAQKVRVLINHAHRVAPGTDGAVPGITPSFFYKNKNLGPKGTEVFVL